jgi:hypothetical protein
VTYSKTVASALAALVVLEAGAAHAQASSSDAAIAQSLFDDGRKLMHQKRYSEACPRLERSYKLDPAAGTLLNVAVCHEMVGKTATAWQEFRDSVAMAKREGRADRVKFAQKHADALKKRINTLTVNDAGHEPGLTWKLDGAKVGTESLGISLPIDPGVHTIEAVAPDKLPWKTTVEVRGEGTTKSLEIPALAAAPKIAPPPKETQPPEVQVVVAPKSHGPSGWVFVTASIGVLGFGAMALGGIEALTAWNDRTAACGIGGDPNACSQAGIDADSRARTWALVSDIGLGVGVAGAITTVIVAIVTTHRSKEAPHVAVSPLVGPGSAGFTLRGDF